MPSRYRLQEEIGRGALGRVVRVVDTHTQRVLAGKMLHDSYLEDQRASERFAREAHLLKGLDHPNIVKVHDLVHLDGRMVLLTELINGPSLQKLIAIKGTIPEAELVRIVSGLASGLAAAHRQGLVHRDLKPANVLISEDGGPRLLDFGLARAASAVGVDPSDFALVGTPDYMAPESVDPLAVDSRSDLYSLGCIMYEMTTGRPPFSGATAFAVVDSHRREPVPELLPTPDRSPQLIALILALLKKTPADRPQSASTVIEALAKLGKETLALAVRADVVAAVATCTRCGSPLLESVPVCFGCRRDLVATQAGNISVFVTGPGGIADKLDALLRQSLVDWIRGNPTLGLDATPLLQTVPRLPFVLVSRIDAESANQIASALQGLGLDCQLRKGGALALPAMRKKVKTLAGRAALIATGALAGTLHVLTKSAFLIVPVTLALVGMVFAIGWKKAVATATVRRPIQDSWMSESLRRVLKAVADAVPSLDAERHRHALRGATQRVLSLAKRRPGQADLGDELAQVLALVTHVVLRLDELEGQLGPDNLRQLSEATRDALKDRDQLAAQLLEITARLDVLQTRRALSSAHTKDSDADEALSELRAEVEALEELQRVH